MIWKCPFAECGAEVWTGGYGPLLRCPRCNRHNPEVPVRHTRVSRIVHTAPKPVTVLDSHKQIVEDAVRLAMESVNGKSGQIFG